MEIRRKPGAKQNLMHEGRVMMIGSDLVTIEAAAELFEVSERVVRNWFKRGASAWEDAIIKSVSRRLLMASSHKSAEAKLIVAVIGQAMADCMSILKYRFGKPASQISVMPAERYTPRRSGSWSSTSGPVHRWNVRTADLHLCAALQANRAAAGPAAAVCRKRRRERLNTVGSLLVIRENRTFTAGDP